MDAEGDSSRGPPTSGGAFVPQSAVFSAGPEVPSAPSSSFSAVQPARYRERNVDDDVVYDTIRGIQAGQRSFYAVVVHYCQPRTTKGDDLVLAMTVADGSCESPDDFLPINVFSPQAEMLPVPHRVGDVVRFRRIRVQMYGGRPQGLKNKTTQAAAVVLFSGVVDSPIVPYFSSSDNYSSVDREKVAALRRVAMTMEALWERLLHLDQLAVNVTKDVACMLLARGSSGSVWVWDGTDVTPVHVPRAPVHGPWPGTVIEVGPANQMHRVFSGIQEGQWCSLRKVYLDVSGKILVTPHAATSVLPPTAPVVVEAMARAERRGMNADGSRWARPPPPAPLPPLPPPPPVEAAAPLLNPVPYAKTIEMGDLPFTPIASIESSSAPSKYRARGRVVGYFPSDVRQCLRVACEMCGTFFEFRGDRDLEFPCQHCQSTGTLIPIYMFQLFVADSTGEIALVVFADDGFLLFGAAGCPPRNLYAGQNADVLARLTEVLGELLSPTAWIEFCVVSYEVAEGDRMARKYRVADTVIELPPEVPRSHNQPPPLPH